MDNRNNQSKLVRIAILFGFLIVFVIVGYFIFTSIQHRGKIKVTISVIPSDSKLTINGQSSKAGTVYLKPGNYNLSASRALFDTDIKTINTNDADGQVIYLLPAPSSRDAINYLNKHPEIQKQRESAGAVVDQQVNQNLTKNHPIVDDLPYTDIGGPFTIDYSIINTVVSLQVSDSSSSGRTNALKWIESQGDNPSNYTIDFQDATNPFAGAQQ